MTYVLIDHLAHREPLSDAAHAAAMFDDATSDILPHGGSGQTLWVGPDDTSEGLRVEIDIDAGRAALTWLADKTVGVELEPGPPITVMRSVDEPLVTVSGSLARVSTETARRAVVEYITTGNRPTCIEWVTDSGTAG
jgi:hypothetical protein